MTEIGLGIALVALLGVIYPHAIYPLLVLLASKVKRDPLAPSQAPSMDVSVCISAYNEEVFIGRCLESVQNQSYRGGNIRVLVADDGSTDKTSSIIKDYAQKNWNGSIESFRFDRVGKNAAVDSLISKVTTDVVVFTDADCVLHPNAIEKVLAPLSNDSVGAVVGLNDRSGRELSNEAAAREESSYRSVETLMNAAESSIASTVTSSGALYAVRKKFITPLPNTQVADDWFHLMTAVRSGKRVKFAANAIVAEARTTNFKAEIERTVRTAACGMATVKHHRVLLGPSYGWYAWFLWSHKLMRWFNPLFLVLLLVGTVLSIQATLAFGFLFYGQFALYALALLGSAAARYGQRVPIASTCLYFVTMNWAFVRGWFRYRSNQQLDIWDPQGGTQ